MSPGLSKAQSWQGRREDRHRHAQTLPAEAAVQDDSVVDSANICTSRKSKYHAASHV